MSQSLKPAFELVVSAPPFWHSGNTTARYMLTLILALLPAAFMAFVHYGFEAVRVMALCVVSSVAIEVLCQRLMHKKVTSYDFSAVLSGLLLAFLLPAASPWWLAVIGSGLSVILGQVVFGGLGANPLCAPLVAWAALTISWPTMMSAHAVQLTSTLTDPLVRLKFFGAADAAKLSYSSLLMGAQLGALGASQVGALLVGGLFLLQRKMLRFEIPLAFLAGVLVCGGIFHMVNPALYINPIFHVLTGSTMLAAFFLAPDFGTSPKRPVGMILYGLLGGAMVVLIRIYGMYPDGAPFAVLLANLVTPHLDKIQPKPFGVR